MQTFAHFTSRKVTHRRRFTSLGNAAVWAWDTTANKVVNTDLVDNQTIFPLELNTMPGWAGSSFTGCVIWMHITKGVCSKEALAYWKM
jgi:leucyl-tRNA synthetase